MARLVKVDEIKLPQGFFEKYDNVPKFYEWLDTLPTVDAVEVVRCKDCLYRDGNACDYSAVYVRPNGYCQWGRRKEDEQAD